MADPALWAELERHEADYTLLFSSLGYTLRVDHRGFAWFHTPSASAPINRISRQLALLFMVIFDTQANAGQTLQRFADWLVTRELLAETHKQHQDMLEAEGLDTEGLRELFDRAAGLGLRSVMAPAGGCCRRCIAIWTIFRHWPPTNATPQTPGSVRPTTRQATTTTS